MARGWPGCLRAVAATALLVEEANKLTFGQPLEVQTPHQVKGILDIKGHNWLTGGRLIKYQALLLDSPELTLKTCRTFNATTLMSAESPGLTHSCLKTLDQVYAYRSDLTGQAIENPEEEWFTDGSSFIKDGVRRARYAVVSMHSVIEAKPLPPNTSAQKAELIALTQALILGEGKIINIYTDSKYAFLVLHAHTAICKERGLLNARNFPIKYRAEILYLIEVVQKPKQITVIHCHGHQKGTSQISQGNNRADWETKKAVLMPITEMALIPSLTPSNVIPRYSTSKENWA